MNAPAFSTRIWRPRGPDLASEVVERYRRYSARNLSDVQGRLGRLGDGVSLSIDRPEDFVGYKEMRLPMGRLILSIGCIEARTGYDLSFKSKDEYIVTVPRQGRGWMATGDIVVEYGLGDVLVISPFCRVNKHWEGPGEVLSIHVPAERFDAAVAKLGQGALPSAPMQRIESHRLRAFLRAVDMIFEDLRDSDGPSLFLRAPLSDQTEQVLLTLLLENIAGGAEAKSEVTTASPAIPYYVRRAEKFIATNAHLQIGIKEIAAASGISVRSIQYGFRAFLQTTPMQYVKSLRYHRARSIILNNKSSRKVSDIAVEIGCANVSQFSRDYRSLFGETPSETIASVCRLIT